MTLDELITILENYRVDFGDDTPVVARSLMFNYTKDDVIDISINNIKNVKHLTSNIGNDYIVINIDNTDIITK
jgi:hypothetical protein